MMDFINKGGFFQLLYRFFKRLFDFIVSLVLSIILIPFFAIIAILIKLDSKGPVFYTHKRVGRNGKPLYLYKFRTMVDKADTMIDSFTEEQKKEWKENFKLQHDPRVTRIGHLLRKTSIDELPQIYNILFGSLSIVGPRPITEEELENYVPKEERLKLLSVTPGLTGWWACNGRSDINYKERVELELYYVDHASILLDVKIIFKTAAAVLTHKGAV